MTLSSWLQMAQARLGAAGIESRKLEASVLAAHVLGVDRSWIYAHPEHEFNELAGEGLLQRREAQEPLAYILGFREFYGRQFRVSPAVLIPRQDTEVLVEVALDLAPRNGKVLDLGTGSGCIAVTMKLERPDLWVCASDVSSDALDIASQNARDLGATMEFVRGDALDPFTGSAFDLIVSNPPYIGRGETLPPDVVEFEPHGALFSGPSGLEFYELLAANASQKLSQDGSLAIEVGYQQAGAVAELFGGHGWSEVARRNDLSGITRVLAFRH